MNIFSAQASCWEAVCQMAMSLTKPAVPNWAPFQNQLVYVATYMAAHNAEGGLIMGPERRHKFEERCNSGCCLVGQWEGHSQGVRHVWWTSATSGARLRVSLNDDFLSFTVRFEGAKYTMTESSYLLEFYRAVNPDTIRVEVLSPFMLRKLAENLSGTDAEVLMHLYSVVFKAAKEEAMV